MADKSNAGLTKTLISVLKGLMSDGSLALGSRLPSGKDAWAADPFVLHMAQIYAYPTYAFLVAGTLWSAWRMRSAPHLRERFVGTLLIAVGATIVAAGSAFAVKGLLAGFSATLAVGVATMFWGFLRASRPTDPASASSGATGASAPADPESPPA